MQKHLCIARITARYLRIAVVMTSCLFLCSSAGAQTVIPPSQPDQIAANVQSLYVNCDMLNTISGPLKAIAWNLSDAVTASAGINIKVTDNTGGTLTITIPPGSGGNPDLVLADDVNNPGVDYILGVVYLGQTGSSAYIAFNTYTIQGVGTGTLTSTPHPSIVIGPTSPGIFPNAFPHIDMFADPNNLIVGLPSMHKYIIAWVEGSSTSSTLRARYGEISTPSVATVSNIMGVGYNNSTADVAASYDVASGKNFGYFAIERTLPAPGSLVFAKLDCTTGVSSSFAVLSSSLPSFPRIEAMGVYDITVSANPWTIISTIYNGFINNIWLFNASNPTGFNCTSALTGTNNTSCSIAAGAGMPYTGFCDSNYVVCWLSRGATNQLCLTQNVYYPTGNISLSYPNYYRANLGTIALASNISLTATSGSSNSGNGLLTVWIDRASNKIYYKLTLNTHSYKPAPTKIEELGLSSYTLYPNPAQDQVTLKTDGNTYLKHVSIYSVLGRMIYSSGASGISAELNTSAFTNGLYQVVIDTDKGQAIRKLEIVK